MMANSKMRKRRSSPNDMSMRKDFLSFFFRKKIASISSCDSVMLGGNEKAHDLSNEVLSGEENSGEEYSGDEHGGDEHGGDEHEEWGSNTHLLSTYNNISLRSVVYKENDPKHDFSLMVQDPKYAGTLIIYAENYMCWRNPSLQKKGGGSAAIRPMAAGTVKTAGAYVASVVTGYSQATGGFEDLGPDEKLIIDLCFHKILNLLNANKSDIHNVIFACDPANKQFFGKSIFNVSDTVVSYISGKFIELLSLTDETDFTVPSQFRMDLICKQRLDRNAILLHNHHMWRRAVKEAEQASIKPGCDIKRVLSSLLATADKRSAMFNGPVTEWHLKLAS